MTNEIMSEISGQALIVTFNRPEHGNTLNYAMATELSHLLKKVSTDRGVRAVLLRGQGGKFIDGPDLNIFRANADQGIELANQVSRPYYMAIRELHAMEKPVLAAVSGNVGGPGMSFMLASDLVLAARDTKFNCRFSAYGLTPDGGMSYFLTRKVGAAKACELMMLSRDLSTTEAENWNLINGVVDDDKLDVEALSLLNRLASGPTRALGGIKMLVGKAFEQNLDRYLGFETSCWASCSRSFDFREAITAFGAKRDPKYKGA